MYPETTVVFIPDFKLGNLTSRKSILKYAR